MAEKTKDPHLVEAISESADVIRVSHNSIVSETRHGFYVQMRY